MAAGLQPGLPSETWKRLLNWPAGLTAPLRTMLPREEMLTALRERDRSYDGLFYAAVTTTGIFCRPSCPARGPKPEHVEFYATTRAALVAGFRPCKRCRPLDPAAGTPEWASRLIARVEADPAARITDAGLRTEGLDPAAVRRWFQKTHGMTFQAYCRARRLGDAFVALRSGDALDEVVFDHGWELPLRLPDGVREAGGGAARRSGGGARRLPHPSRMAGDAGRPARRRRHRRGAGHARVPRPAHDGDAVGHAAPALRPPARPRRQPALRAPARAAGRVLRRTPPRLRPPLEYPGSPFQRRVWDALLRIPFGETRTYAELASAIGAPGAARAVGSANGANRLAILIPATG